VAPVPPLRASVTVAIGSACAGEPLTDYITPVGGGCFHAPPGPRGPGGYVGSGLFRAA
jgi:deferrochelatase/peroxidase EfeB